MKKLVPHNPAQLKCCVCLTENLRAHETHAANNQGQVHLIDLDSWPTYYIDQGAERFEFCGPACILEFRRLQKTNTTGTTHD